MPRKSPEERSAAMYRAGGKPPEPPADLNPDAARIWRLIASSRPADWFDHGSLPLLRRLCRTAVSVERLHDAYDALDPTSSKAAELAKQITAMNASVAGLSQKLRLSVQNAIVWDSGKRTERAGLGNSPLRKSRLLGGFALAGDDDDDLLYPGSVRQ
jgi:hypothetical protein